MNALKLRTEVLPLKPVMSKTGPVQQQKDSAKVRFGSNLIQDFPYVIDLSAPIDSKIVNAAIQLLQVMALEKRKTSDSGSIKLMINSPGGSVTEGFKLISVINQLGVPVDTIVMGTAASMGATLLLAGGTKGRRFISRYSTVMIHQPSIKGIGGTSEQVNDYNKEMVRTRNTMDGIISHTTGLPLNKVRELTSHETFIPPLQALKDGFVDWIITENCKGLTRDSIKHLKDNEIFERDQYNRYDDLVQYPFDPMLSKPKIMGAEKLIEKRQRLGPPAQEPPPSKATPNPPPVKQDPSKEGATLGRDSITRLTQPGENHQLYFPKLEIYA